MREAAQRRSEETDEGSSNLQRSEWKLSEEDRMTVIEEFAEAFGIRMRTCYSRNELSDWIHSASDALILLVSEYLEKARKH